MGAKQSKRSVDISGKEAEGAGEVAAAGAGGEGRVEQLADADALKPQLNGDAHIHETSDKEKQLDSGTPENEKDATTEKEGKEGEGGKEKESPAVTNGESEQKEENGEALATSEDTKKPKKEKVKKKWSLRSISFSRKDKPKQEKKAKEDEAKTPNGEQEKLSEEVAETNPENVVNEVAEEAKSDSDTKDEKSPETPVTEPIANGSNTPESPKTEPSPTDEPIPETPEDNRPEPNAALPEPEQLPVNGLSLDEPKVEAPIVAKSEESNIEKVTSETSESVPAQEIPVTKEVCVEQMPMIEPSPPPLPANPPPSSVASFAATTMAPELTDASLDTAADITSTASPIAITDTKTDVTDPIESNHHQPDVENTTTNIPFTIKKTVEETTAFSASDEVKRGTESIPIATNNEVNGSENEVKLISDMINDETIALTTVAPSATTVPDKVDIPEIVINDSQSTQDLSSPTAMDDDSKQNHDDTDATVNNELIHDKKESIVDNCPDQKAESNDNNVKDFENMKNAAKDSQINVIVSVCNGKMEDTKSKTEELPPANNTVDDVIADAGKTSPDDSLPPSLSEAMESQAGEVSNDASESFPLPPSELCRSEEVSPPNTPTPAIASPQDVLPITDKMADLIPEVPVVPELKTDMETTSDVAVAN